jgi:hypothetical protein
MANSPHSAAVRTEALALLSYSKHWHCLFPQHEPGMKHQRVIRREPWQQEIVDAFPREFLRGLIHSDGCRIMNWTAKIAKGELRRYEYPRYHFNNESSHIRELFTDSLDKLGIEWRKNRENCICVAKRPRWPRSTSSSDRNSDPLPEDRTRTAESGSREIPTATGPAGEAT